MLRRPHNIRLPRKHNVTRWPCTFADQVNSDLHDSTWQRVGFSPSGIQGFTYFPEQEEEYYVL